MQHLLVASETSPLSLLPACTARPSCSESCETSQDSKETATPQLAVTPEERRTMQTRVRRLRRHSLLTPTALAQLGDRHLPAQTLHALLTMLEGPFESRWEERTVAAWALGLADLTARQREMVSVTLSGILRRRPFVRRLRPDQQIDPVLVWLACCVSLWLGLNSVFHPTLNKVTLSPTSLLFCGGIIGLFCCRFLSLSLKAWVSIRDSRLRATAATALGRLGSVSSVALLARAALEPNARVRHAAEPALCACLANLTPQHIGQLEVDVVPNLCRLLEGARALMNQNSARAETLALDVLHALEKIGDGQAAPTVRKMINTGWTAPVNHAAKRLLPLLRARQQQETDQRGLLRGATMPPSAPNTLLRPTGLLEEEDSPNRLLRSSHHS